MKKIKLFFKFILLLPRRIEVNTIKLYQNYISTALGNHCKYYPTCSEYTKQAVDKYGIIKGNILGLLRVIKCNPFSHGGIDYLK